MSALAMDTAAEAMAAPAVRTLTGSRGLDLALTGGVSLVAWTFATLALARGIEVGRELTTPVVALGVLLVNNPHFMASYRLGYGRGRAFLGKNRVPLIVVPVALAVMIGVGWFARGWAFASWPLVAPINSGLAALGISGRLGRQPTFGAELLAAMSQGMYFLVGWHYAKQTFGVCLVFARFDGVSFDARRRLLLKAHVLAWWALSFIGNNEADDEASPPLPFAVRSLGLPRPLLTVAVLVVLLTGGLLIAASVTAARTGAKVVSWRTAIPLLALCGWLVPGVIHHPGAFVLVIPLFHSLQYLPFSYRAGGTPGARPWRIALSGFELVFAGLLAFWLVPKVIDAVTASEQSLGFAYWGTAIVLFINVHHYFIDSAIWRMGDPDVRQRLLG